MQEKINKIETKISLLQQEVESLKDNHKKIEHVEQEVCSIKNTVVRMEMIDKSIFEKLDVIVKSVEQHKDNFVSHDKKEMEKYGAIDTRLIKIEKLIFMAMGAFIVIELLYKFKIIGVE